MLDTILKNVRVLQATGWQFCDVAIEYGKIMEVKPDVVGVARTVIDGGGAYCIPGAVDLHVHFNEPGRTHWEGFETGSAAAVAGGITTFAEMPLNSIPSTVSVDALRIKLDAAWGKSYADFGLWGGVVPGNAEQIEPLAKAGVMGFKAFMSPSGTNDFMNSDVETLRGAMIRVARTGLRLALHAEDPAVLDVAGNKIKQKETAIDWEASRPVAAEISAVEVAIELAKETNCPITIVHVSSAEVLAVIEAAKAAGVDIVCETCPHYLLLTREDADRIGPNAKCAPPLRSAETVAALRAALMTGQIDTIGSDHSPSSPDLKKGKSFFDAWGGISGLQHGLPLLFDSFDLKDTGDIQHLIHAFSTRPASLTGLRGKGALQPEASADFCLIRERSAPRILSTDHMLYRHRQSAYTGMPLMTEIEQTWLRGKCVYKNGKIVAMPSGRFIDFSKRSRRSV